MTGGWDRALVVSDTLQCVDVGWTEPPDLPDWIGITVTDPTVTASPITVYARRIREPMLPTLMRPGTLPPVLDFVACMLVAELVSWTSHWATRGRSSSRLSNMPAVPRWYAATSFCLIEASQWIR